MWLLSFKQKAKHSLIMYCYKSLVTVYLIIYALLGVIFSIASSCYISKPERVEASENNHCGLNLYIENDSFKVRPILATQNTSHQQLSFTFHTVLYFVGLFSSCHKMGQCSSCGTMWTSLVNVFQKAKHNSVHTDTFNISHTFCLNIQLYILKPMEL